MPGSSRAALLACAALFLLTPQAAAAHSADAAAEGGEAVIDDTLGYLAGTNPDGTLAEDSYPGLAGGGLEVIREVGGSGESWLDSIGDAASAIAGKFKVPSGEKVAEFAAIFGLTACILNPACGTVLTAGVLLGWNADKLRDLISERFPGILPGDFANLPTVFSGAVDGEDVTYGGTRNGRTVAGGYSTGDGGTGTFSGTLSRNLRVQGRLAEDGATGVFSGTVTQDLSKAFGSAVCTSGCDD